MGNARDYASFAVPSGWTRYTSTQTRPQPGDIAIWLDEGYGHVGIVVGPNQTVEQNVTAPYDGSGPGMLVSRVNYQISGKTFYGVLRPNFTLGGSITPTLKYIVMEMNGNLYGKEGVGSSWTMLSNGTTKKIEVVGNNIFYLTTSGTLLAKENLNGVFRTLDTNVDDFEVSNNLIVYKKGGSLYGKNGILGSVTLLSTGVSSKFHVESGRIAYTSIDNNNLYIKESMQSPWVLLTTGVNEFKLSGKSVLARINSTLVVKEDIYASWLTLTNNSTENFNIEGTRIAYVSNKGDLLAKEGFTGEWMMLTNGVTDFKLENKRIIARKNNFLWGKDDLTSPWLILVDNSGEKYDVKGGNIVYIDVKGNLNMKSNLNSPWVKLSDNVKNFGI